MSNIIIAQPLTAPRCSINVRPATTADLPFIDQLQKMHSHMVGFMPLKAMQKHVEDGNVLVAEEIGMRCQGVRCQGVEGGVEGGSEGGVKGGVEGAPSTPRNLDTSTPSSLPIGYILARDQYMKRDDVGIVYQLNVLPMRQRNLVGAMLIKSVFEKAAYGCRLFSCWCAQDIRANYFWESIGFVPLAFRTGSRSKQRIHIFWQRRVREHDEYPYWFPSKTEGGAVMEDRIVLPIPLDAHWRDVKPLVLPGMGGQPSAPPLSDQRSVPLMLPGGAPVKARPDQPKLTAAQKAAIHRSQCKALGGVPLGKKAVITASGIRYVAREDYIAETDAPEELLALNPPKVKKPRRGGPRAKNDPKFIAAARELRDRYLDEVNSGRCLPPAWAAGKYDVSKPLQLTAAGQSIKPPALLDAA